MTFLAKASGPVFGGLCLAVVELEYLLQLYAGRQAPAQDQAGSASTPVRVWRQVWRSAADLSLVAAGGVVPPPGFSPRHPDPPPPPRPAGGGERTAGAGGTPPA